jgi:hypothetical protein
MAAADAVEDHLCFGCRVKMESVSITLLEPPRHNTHWVGYLCTTLQEIIIINVMVFYDK